MQYLSWICMFAGLAFILIGMFTKKRKKSGSDAKDKYTHHSKEDEEDRRIRSKKSLKKTSYGPISIYFGSQTGTAANLANNLAQEASQNGFTPKIIDLIDFNAETLKSTNLAVFLMATHGEGEPTDNSKDFNKWLCDGDRADNELSNLKFSVFGLGNKSYQFYNGQARKINKFIEKLGADRVYAYGEGDDQGSLEDDFDDWKKDLWSELKSKLPAVTVTEMTSSHSTDDKKVLPFILDVVKVREANLEFVQLDETTPYDFQIKQYLSCFSATVKLVRELRQNTADGSTLHIEIDIKKSGMSYTTASNLTIYPENSMESVNRLAKLLDLNLSDVFVLKDNKNYDNSIKFKYPFPTPISVETYLTKFCDIHGPVKKKQLKDLSAFCYRKQDKEKLIFLASPSGKVEFEAQIQSSMLGLVDVIEKFNIHVDLKNLILIASNILPRYYTIASSNQKDPTTIHLCVSLKQDVLPSGSKKYGLTSGYFNRLFELYNEKKSLPKLKIAIRESTFELPTDNKLPIYMVGPGAGIAPFKGFIDEKIFLKQSNQDSPYGEMTLYFGCKGTDWDHLYKDELHKHHEDKHIENYHVAFSREKDRKTYVQDLIESHKSTIIKDIFEKNGVLYICGTTGMGKSVLDKIAGFASSYYKVDAAAAKKKVEEMEEDKRIIKELWG